MTTIIKFIKNIDYNKTETINIDYIHSKIHNFNIDTINKLISKYIGLDVYYIHNYLLRCELYGTDMPYIQWEINKHINNIIINDKMKKFLCTKMG